MAVPSRPLKLSRSVATRFLSLFLVAIAEALAKHCHVHLHEQDTIPSSLVANIEATAKHCHLLEVVSTDPIWESSQAPKPLRSIATSCEALPHGNVHLSQNIEAPAKHCHGYGAVESRPSKTPRVFGPQSFAVAIAEALAKHCNGGDVQNPTESLRIGCNDHRSR